MLLFTNFTKSIIKIKVRKVVCSKFIIYRHVNLTTNKCYIGLTSKTLKSRWNKHLEAVRNGSEYHFHRAIRKYGENDWSSEVLEIVEEQSSALKTEKHWIFKFQSNNHEFGYNSTTGGEGPIPNDEVRRKLSISQKKRYENPEERLKISRAAKFRKPVSEETRKKLSECKSGAKNHRFGKPGTQLGRKASPEKLEKLRIAATGRTLSLNAKKKCSIASHRRWALFRLKNSLPPKKGDEIYYE